MASLIAHALWKRLDTPGHDAAFLFSLDNGFELRGTAVFRSAQGPARIAYRVELDLGWSARAGSVTGEMGTSLIAHDIRRDDGGWRLDGAVVEGLAHLHDLDFGFTPATNMTALRRVGLAVGDQAELPAAWFDVETPRPQLVDLPQHYERRSETAYFYRSPSASYQAVLDMAPNGFTRRYPGLWKMIEQ
jgi:hypothetical protein